MKRKGIVFGAILLALLFMFVTGAAAAQGTFSFRNGVTWDATVEAVLAAEGVLENGEYYSYDAGTYQTYTVDAETSDSSWQIGYAFRGDALCFAAIYYEDAPTVSFLSRRLELSLLYGAPAETDAQHAVALFNAIDEGSLEEEDVSQIAGWTLSDGTAVFLMEMYEEIYLFYFNEPRILTAGEPASTYETMQTWDFSPQQLVDAGVMDDHASARDESYGDVRMIEYTVIETATADYANASSYSYTFYGDLPVHLLVIYGKDEAGAYEARKAMLAAQYGEPLNSVPADVMDFANAFTLTDITGTGDQAAYAIWMPDADTAVILVAEEGYVRGAFVHLRRLEALGAYMDGSAQEPEPADGDTDTFMLENGVGWDTTLQEVFQIVGEDYSAYYEDWEVYQELHYDERQLGGETVQIALLFLDDLPFAIAISYDRNSAITYETRLAEAVAQWGEPQETDAVHVLKLYTDALNSPVEAEQFEKVAGWTLADGTLAYLLQIDGYIGTAYFQEERTKTLME